MERYNHRKTNRGTLRQERNQLLKDCDHCALPDFPNRENYILYRQELRELPENWTIDTTFPQNPT